MRSDRVLTLRRSFDNRRGVAATLCNLGHALCRLKESDRAEACFREGLDLGLALGSQVLICLSMCGLGGVALARGEAERAAILLGASGRLTYSSGSTFETPDRVDYEWMAAQARAALPEAVFAVVWEKGRQMTFDQAVAYARAAT